MKEVSTCSDCLIGLNKGSLRLPLQTFMDYLLSSNGFLSPPSLLVLDWPKICLGFPITVYGRTRTNFWANSLFSKVCPEDFLPMIELCYGLNYYPNLLSPQYSKDETLVVLEKTLESPLDCKEIKPINPKGNWTWIFIGRSDAEAEAPIPWPPRRRANSLKKTLMLGKIESKRRSGWWLDGLNQWTWVRANLACLLNKQAWLVTVHMVAKSQRWLSDWTTTTASNMMVSGNGSFVGGWSYLGLDEVMKVGTSWWNSYKKRQQRDYFLSFLPWEAAVCKPGWQPSAESTSAGTLILEFPGLCEK